MKKDFEEEIIEDEEDFNEEELDEEIDSEVDAELEGKGESFVKKCFLNHVKKCFKIATAKLRIAIMRSRN